MLTNDELWEQYNGDLGIFYANHDWGKIRNTYLEMSQLTLREGKNYHAAFFGLCVLYMDVNVCENCYGIDLCRQGLEKAPRFNLPLIAPGVSGLVHELRSQIDREMIEKVYEFISTPYSPIDIDTFEQITMKIARRGNGDLKKFKPVLHETFLKNCEG